MNGNDYFTPEAHRDRVNGGFYGSEAFYGRLQRLYDALKADYADKERSPILSRQWEGLVLRMRRLERDATLGPEFKRVLDESLSLGPRLPLPT
jgi:hypothetical protein